MKQYTSKDQTAKLIELGFPKPTRTIIVDGFPTTDMLLQYASYKDDFGFVVCYEGYSIGELIEFLYCYNFSLSIYGLKGATWQVWAENKIWETELIDALFKACVTLKEEGVI